jgi:hypothetical protein
VAAAGPLAVAQPGALSFGQVALDGPIQGGQARHERWIARLGEQVAAKRAGVAAEVGQAHPQFVGDREPP